MQPPCFLRVFRRAVKSANKYQYIIRNNEINEKNWESIMIGDQMDLKNTVYSLDSWALRLFL